MNKQEARSLALHIAICAIQYAQDEGQPYAETQTEADGRMVEDELRAIRERLTRQRKKAEKKGAVQ